MSHWACAGGDLYDFFPLDDRQDGRADTTATPSRWCVFIGDVEGHGLAAAVVMAIVQTVLHVHPAGIATPAGLLMYGNRQLCSSRIGGLVTAFLGIYEPASRRLTYASAGHPPPLLRRTADGTISALDGVGSYPLGIDASETFQEASVELVRGDILLLYTDGITDARRTAADLFGVDRLTRVLRDGGDRPAELIDRLREAVRRTCTVKPPKTTRPLLRQESYRRRLAVKCCRHCCCKWVWNPVKVAGTLSTRSLASTFRGISWYSIGDCCRKRFSLYARP